MSVPVVFIASSGCKDFSIRQWFHIFAKRQLEHPNKIRFQELPGDSESLFIQVDVSSDAAAYQYLDVLHNRELATCHFQVLKPTPRQQIITELVKQVAPIAGMDLRTVLRTLRKVAVNILSREERYLTLDATKSAVQNKILQHHGMEEVLLGLGFTWNEFHNQLSVPRNRIHDEVCGRVVTVCDHIIAETGLPLATVRSNRSSVSAEDFVGDEKFMQFASKLTSGGPVTPGGPDDMHGAVATVIEEEKRDPMAKPKKKNVVVIDKPADLEPENILPFRVGLQCGSIRQLIEVHPRDSVRSFLEEISSIFEAHMVQISLVVPLFGKLNLEDLDLPLETFELQPNQKVVIHIDTGIQPRLPRPDQVVSIRRVLLNGSRRGSMQAESLMSISTSPSSSSSSVVTSTDEKDNEAVTLHCHMCGTVSPAVDGEGLRALRRAPTCSACRRSYSNDGVHFWLCPNTYDHAAGYQFCQKCAGEQFARENDPSYVLPHPTDSALVAVRREQMTKDEDMARQLQEDERNGHDNEYGDDEVVLEEYPVTRMTQLDVDALDDETQHCAICLRDYADGDEIRTLPCFHRFHRTCIDPWLEKSRTCPVDRTAL